MTRRRWIADEVSGDRAFLIGDHADHLARVLRARVGQEFDIATGPVVRLGRVVSVAENRIEFELGEEVPAASVANVTLLLSIFKFDRFEWAIEKCTELGISGIVPVIANRTDAHLGTTATKRVERWRRIALQATEQSRRSAPPEIADPMKLPDAASFHSPLRTHDLRIVLSESEPSNSLRSAIEGSRGDLALAIGPEGGWTDAELKLFQREKWISASLGQTILRAETAAIAAAAICISEFDSRVLQARSER
jgi:16S rRNA (uracil1498-N3)-methyltransferase